MMSIDYVQTRIDTTAGMLECPVCRNSSQFVEDPAKGDIVCANCGVVMSERVIDEGREWRNFSDSDKDRSRAEGVDEFINELTTDISRSPNATGDLARMSKVQNRIALDSNARNLVSAFEKIGHYAEVMKLPNNIRNKAKSLYKQFEEKRSKTMRGTKKEAIIAAVLYMACKEELVPRTFKELAKETGIKEKDIRKFYRNLAALLPKTVNTAQAVSPVDLVNRFCSKLKLPHEIVTAACAVADKATPQLEGKSPSSIAAASILMVTKLSDQKRWEKDIAEAASISPTTIRNVYKEMQMLPGLLPVENPTPKTN
eukprot:TRINITY_DN6401_c0_g1_i1.p1 TRINITY_DN6401_c0_g1~~TRINITY_DN6401_c0_g1_i1.p1  ORF type:complete len:313 (-),score=68.79 TRINITY_DN6401_c0_g1_i1:198-1136(-)